MSGLPTLCHDININCKTTVYSTSYAKIVLLICKIDLFWQTERPIIRRTDGLVGKFHFHQVLLLESWKWNFPVFDGNYDRPTDQPYNQPSNQPTNMKVDRQVTDLITFLPIDVELLVTSPLELDNCRVELLMAAFKMVQRFRYNQ